MGWIAAIGRRGAASTPPPSGILYGPTLGRDTIINNAGAQPVSNPGGGVTFNSSSDLQTKINANAVGTLFVCSVTNPTWNSSVNCGTKAPTIIFPGATVMDGSGAAIRPLLCGAGTGSIGTTVKGGTFQNFSPTQSGIELGQNATLEDITVKTFTAGDGITIANSSGATLRRLTIQDIGNTGIVGGLNTDGILIENCEFLGNNTLQLHPGDEGGAMKALLCGNGIFRENYLHNNIGFGMWWDTNCWGWTIEENVSEDNDRSGFFFEANYGSVINNNLIKNNGRDIAIGGQTATFAATVNCRLSDNSASRTDPDGFVRPMDFHHNLVDHTLPQDGQTGGLLYMWDHTATAVRHVSNNDVHHNQFWMRFTHTVGGNVSRVRAEDTATTGFPIWSLDNRFFSNEYLVPAGQTGNTWWQWGTGTQTGSPKNYTAWQGFHPNDNLPLVSI